MGYMYCEGLQLAEQLETQAVAQVPALLDELRQYVRPAGEIGIRVRRVLYEFSGWAVEADLTYDGEVVRSYPAFDLLVLELNQIELSILAACRAAEKGVA